MFDELGLRSHVQDMYSCRVKLVREVGEHNASSPHGSSKFLTCYLFLTFQPFLGSSVIIRMTEMIPHLHGAVVCFGATVSSTAGPLHPNTKAKA